MATSVLLFSTGYPVYFEKIIFSEICRNPNFYKASITQIIAVLANTPIV